MGTLYTRNNEIMVSKSPFAAYENEKIIYDGRTPPLSIDIIMMKVKKSHIIAIDFQILEAIDFLEFSTSRMITQYLNTIKNIDISQEKVNNRLKVLNKSSIIGRWRFESDEGITYTRVYFLERGGKVLLLSQNYAPKWKPSDSIRPISNIKQILVRNDIYLKLNEEVKNIKNIELNHKVNNINSHLCVEVLKENSSKLLVEVVRSYDKCIEKFIEKMKSYNLVYNNNISSLSILKKPSLVIVAESDAHLSIIYRNLYFNKLTDNMDIYYTTDQRIIERKSNEQFLKMKIVRMDNKDRGVLSEIKFEDFLL